MSPNPDDNHGAFPDQPGMHAAESIESIASAGPWSERQAAKILWRAGIKRQLSLACDDPDVEDVELRLGDGRRGDGAELAQKAATHPWFEVSDGIQEDNWAYVAQQRDQSVERIFFDATGLLGPLAPLREALCSRMAELDPDFDEDEFWASVGQECLEMAREDGLDAVFDVKAVLLGGCQAQVSQNFSFPRLPDGEQAPMLPDLSSLQAARDWAQGLSFFNIHPAKLANAVRSKVLSQLADPDYFDGIGAQTASERAKIRRDTRSSLELLGMSRPVGRDPESWSGGMALLAQAWSSSGWSLPRHGAPPAISPADLVDVLSDDHGDIEALLTFGADGDALQFHSELIDRFDENSPLCAEPLARQSMSIAHADLTFGDRDIAFCGPIPVFVLDLSFDSESSSDSGLDPCMGAARASASQASELSWLLRSPSGEANADPDARARSDKRAASIAASLASQSPAAFEWARASASARGDVSAVSERLALEGFEQGVLAASARAARLGKSFPPPTIPRPARIDDFDVRYGGLMSAPWRSLVKPALASKRDSLGNTLAHKACACADPALLRFALDAAPALATASNFGGQTAIDLIHHAQVQNSFIPLALALLSRRPDLADSQAASGRTLLDLAAARNLPATDLAKLLDAGCSLSTLDAQGRAPWFHWVHKPASELTSLLAPAIARGWDVNQADRYGRSLSHMVTRLESAQALLSLGSDFSRPDADGRPGGCSIPERDFATLEAQLLDSCPHPAAPRARAKSL